MGKNKRRFIDKKNAVTFHLVHRSQQDPLITDETAPQMVLVESAVPNQSQPGPSSGSKSSEDRRKDLVKFGIFFDDDYNYLQHLKEPGKDVVAWERVEPPNSNRERKEEKKKLQLPSSVFASEFEEDEGMLRKAAPRFGPRPDWDPDIVAALDDDFDFDDPENQLDDDFITKAMDGEDDDDEEYEDEEDEDDEDDVDSNNQFDVSDYDEDEENDKVGPLQRPFRERNFDEEETRSKFTEYSMSSSVIRRNEQLTLLDDRFEKFYDQYDDNEIGPLDLEDIDGHIELNDELLMSCVHQFKKDKEVEQYDKNWDVIRLTKLQEHGSNEDLVEVDAEPKKEKWDCESILSTYSNIYNHPKLIDEPKKNKSNKIVINPKTGMPMNVLNGDGNKLTAKTLAKLDNQQSEYPTGPKSLCEQSVLSTLSVLSIRPKDETLEEKKERKRLLKEYRFERRMERKANTDAFTKEKVRQQKQKANNMINISGTKIV